MPPRIMLRKGRGQRQRAGHPWVYDGEIAAVKGQPVDGGVVDCMSWNGTFLGRGFYNSRSKIRLRILTRHQGDTLDYRFLQKRLAWALQRREQLYPQATSLRLVHAEGDLLPGLTVDRYGDALVVQCAALGMDQRQDEIVGILKDLTGIEHVYCRNNFSMRRNDGLPLASHFWGKPFPTARQIEVGGLAFDVDLAEGHKTGFYLDQADNHLALRQYVPSGGVVLDAFCYTGAFALQAAAAGAATVLGLDSSEAVLALARRNAERNGLSERCSFQAGNVFDQLRQLAQDGVQYDLAILDPPSFTRHRDAVSKALSGYKEINLQALKLLRPGGILVTFTCSYYVDRLHFETMLQQAAGDARRQLIVRQRLSQAGHHPEVLSIPETGYLKGLAVEVW
jgi:23S rRNA (cytosine1962-C5)-methyltransferase